MSIPRIPSCDSSPELLVTKIPILFVPIPGPSGAVLSKCPWVTLSMLADVRTHSSGSSEFCRRGSGATASLTLHIDRATFQHPLWVGVSMARRTTCKPGVTVPSLVTGHKKPVKTYFSEPRQRKDAVRSRCQSLSHIRGAQPSRGAAPTSA